TANPQPVADAPVQVQALTLSDCVGMALGQQPALEAHRSSLAAAETQKRALDKIHVPTIVKRDLPIRRRQACMGVLIASAALQKTERETAYAVVRTYFSALYAKKQEAVARLVVAKLKEAQKRAEALAKEGNPDIVVTQSDVDKLKV